jgi:hypothetical protein
MANLATNVPLVNEQFVDPQTGRITEAWFIFLIQLWRRTGGGGGTTPTSITLDDVFSVEETFGYAAPVGVVDFLSQIDTMAMRPITGPDNIQDMVFAPVGSSSSGGSGSITDQTFSSGTDFTPGVTTSLTLANSFTNQQQLWVYFDGTFQGDDQYSLSGVALTFTSAIPVGVSKVYVKGLR